MPRLIRFPHPESRVEQRQSPRQTPPRRRIGKSRRFRHSIQSPICASHRRFTVKRPRPFFCRPHASLVPFLAILKRISRPRRMWQIRSRLHLSCARKNSVRAGNRPAAITQYGRPKNDASTAETARSIGAFTFRRKYSERWEQGRRPKRRKKVGDHAGRTPVRWHARRCPLNLHLVFHSCRSPPS